MSTTKLAKLLIGEVSGVDAPANMLDGWMVQKAAGKRSFGPVTETWDVGEAEARVREATGAIEAPNGDYASCFLWVGKESEPSFGDFRFLVNDVVDGEIVIMPAALDAVEQRLETSTIPEQDKAEVSSVIKSLRGEMAQPEAEDATSIVGKIKSLLLGKEIDVTTDELNAALDARFAAFGETIAEQLAKSAEIAPTGEVATEPGESTTEVPAVIETTEAPAEIVPALSAEDVTKAVEDALQPVLEVLDKTLDRIATLERGGVARKSIDGQDNTLADGETPKVPEVKDAIAKALGHGARA